MLSPVVADCGEGGGGDTAAPWQCGPGALDALYMPLFKSAPVFDEISNWMKYRATPAEAAGVHRHGEHVCTRSRNIAESMNGFKYKLSPPYASNTCCRLLKLVSRQIHGGGDVCNAASVQSRLHAAATNSQRGATAHCGVVSAKSSSKETAETAQKDSSAPSIAASSKTPSHISNAGHAHGRAMSAVHITTTQASHGLAQLCPELWASTVPICRPQPVPSRTFTSEWGSALARGADKAWAPFLGSTYAAANAAAARPVWLALLLCKIRVLHCKYGIYSVRKLLPNLHHVPSTNQHVLGILSGK